MASLTHQEKVVLVFLGAFIIIGTGVNFYLKHMPKAINIYSLHSKSEIALKVNLNNANVEELVKLPGIGPELARRIIEYRNTYGSFKGINEIKKVKGIGDKKFENLQKFLLIR